MRLLPSTRTPPVGRWGGPPGRSDDVEPELSPDDYLDELGTGVLFERLNAHVKCWHTFRSNTCLDPAVGTVFKHLPMLLLAHC